MEKSKLLKELRPWIIAVLIIGIIWGTFATIDHVRWQRLFAVTSFMYNFQYVDRITLHINGEETIVSISDPNFQNAKDALYPFDAGRIGLPSGQWRTLQRQSIGKYGTIEYFVDGDRLFTVEIYVFDTHPHSDNYDFIHQNVFAIGDLFAIGVIIESNFLASFPFDDLSSLP